VGHRAPFPVVIAGHGYRRRASRHVLGFRRHLRQVRAGDHRHRRLRARHRIDPVLEAFGRLKAHQYGLDAFADAVFRGRARDLDYDGIKGPRRRFLDRGHFHTRDVVRQSVVDWMQLVRLLRSFDGHGAMLLGGALPLAATSTTTASPTWAARPSGRRMSARGLARCSTRA